MGVSGTFSLRNSRLRCPSAASGRVTSGPHSHALLVTRGVVAT